MQMRERHGDIDVLRRELQLVTSDGGRVVVVRGEAGIGKSTLVKAFIENLERPVLIGRCDDTRIPIALGPFRDIFRAAGSPDHAEPDSARVELNRLLDRTPVVVIEDIHWADEASFDLLTYVCRRVEDTRSMIVLTHRPEAPAALARTLTHTPTGHLTDIELRPLSRDAVVAWAGERGRDGDAVFAKTQGNPFLVGELLADPESEIPARISASTLARLAQLSPSAREAAHLLAQFPGGARWETFEALRTDSREALAELEHHRWLEVHRGRVLLRHELIREAIVTELAAATRRSLNREILEVLIRHDADPAPIAHHAAEAGDDQRSIDYAVVAAEQLSRAGAHHDALVHLERVAHLAHLLHPQEHAHFVEALGMERMAGDHIDGACAALADAFERWIAIGDRESAARTLRATSGAEWRRGDVERSNRLLREALALLEGSDHHLERFRIRITIGQNAGLASRWPEALEMLSEAIDTGDEISDDATAVAIAMRADARRLLGDDTGASEDYARSIELAESDAPSTMTTLLNRVATSLAVLDPVAARGHLSAAESAGREHTSEHTDRFIVELRAGLRLLSGDWDGALADVRDRLDDPLTVRTRPALIAGLVRTRRGDVSGVDLVTDAHQRASGLRDIQRLGGTAGALAELLWLGMIPDEFADEILDVTQLAHDSGHARFSAELALWCRRLGLDGGDPNPLGPPGLLREFEGDWRAAASMWKERGVPYLELLSRGFSDDAEALRTAIDQATAFGASAVADRLRARLRKTGHRVRRGRGRATLHNPGGLTNRQIDVARLLAEGLTNQQIAGRLFISPKTVDHHVSAILTTLGVADRAHAGEWARVQGLI